MNESPTASPADSREMDGFFPIQGVARFAVTGADRSRYLNGQITNDLKRLEPDTSLSACVLSAKGRLEAVIRIWESGDSFIVECPEELAEPLHARLEKYVVADDVTIEPKDVPEEIHVIGRISKPEAGLRIADRLGFPGADFPAEFAGHFEASGAVALTPETREVIRIRRLQPVWGKELGPDTLPAEAGLDRTAVDFHKGCYIGQETVSRVKSVGHVNRSLRGFVAAKNSPICPGDGIFDPANDAKPVGTVTSIAEHIDLADAVGLCYIRRGADPDAALEVRGGRGSAPIQLFSMR